MLRAGTYRLKNIIPNVAKPRIDNISIMSHKPIETIPPPVHRGMTKLDKDAFVTCFSRLGVKIDKKDVTNVTKAKEMRP
jgi:hypothetical protein